MHLNCRGVRAKTDELCQLLQDTQTDVATLNETHLNASIRPYFPGYTFFRRDYDASARTGGVAILVRNTLRATSQPLPNNPTNSLLVKISFPNAPPYTSLQSTVPQVPT